MKEIINNKFDIETANFTYTDEVLENLQYGDNSSRYYFVLNRLFSISKSFKKNNAIPIYASSDKSKNINIHHIVPKSLYFEGAKVVSMRYGNSILNLAPILETENAEIKAKYPADYYATFQKDNPKIDGTLSEMLIEPEYLKTIKKETKIDTLNLFWKKRRTDLIKLLNIKNDL